MAHGPEVGNDEDQAVRMGCGRLDAIMRAPEWMILVANVGVVGVVWWEGSGAPELVTLALLANSLQMAILVNHLAAAKHDLDASLRMAREMMKRQTRDWGE